MNKKLIAGIAGFLTVVGLTVMVPADEASAFHRRHGCNGCSGRAPRGHRMRHGRRHGRRNNHGCCGQVYNHGCSGYMDSGHAGCSGAGGYGGYNGGAPVPPDGEGYEPGASPSDRTAPDDRPPAPQDEDAGSPPEA